MYMWLTFSFFIVHNITQINNMRKIIIEVDSNHIYYKNFLRKN